MARISAFALLLLCVVSAAGCVGATSGHSVTLNWNPSTSVVTGYNVYRSASLDGPWIRIGTTGKATLSFTDFKVQGGQLYYYAVSAVGSDGVESGLSDAVSAMIPST